MQPEALTSTPVPAGHRDRGWMVIVPTILLGAVACGYLGARLALGPLRDALAVRPPLVIIDMAAALNGMAPERTGALIAAQRDLARRLADADVLVLDAQAVIAAPKALYLPPIAGERQ